MYHVLCVYVHVRRCTRVPMCACVQVYPSVNVTDDVLTWFKSNISGSGVSNIICLPFLPNEFQFTTIDESIYFLFSY